MNFLEAIRLKQLEPEVIIRRKLHPERRLTLFNTVYHEKKKLDMGLRDEDILADDWVETADEDWKLMDHIHHTEIRIVQKFVNYLKLDIEKCNKYSEMSLKRLIDDRIGGEQ